MQCCRHVQLQSAPFLEAPAAQPTMLSVIPSAESVLPRSQEPGQTESPPLKEAPMLDNHMNAQDVEQEDPQQPELRNDGEGTTNANLHAPATVHLPLSPESIEMYAARAAADTRLDMLGASGVQRMPLGMAPGLDAVDDAYTGASSQSLGPANEQLLSAANDQSIPNGRLGTALALSGTPAVSGSSAGSLAQDLAAAPAEPIRLSLGPVKKAQAVDLHFSQAQGSRRVYAKTVGDTDSEISDTDISDDDSSGGSPIMATLSLRPGTGDNPGLLQGQRAPFRPVMLQTPLQAAKPSSALRLGFIQNGLHPTSSIPEPSSLGFSAPAQKQLLSVKDGTSMRHAVQPATAHPDGDVRPFSADKHGRDELPLAVTGAAAFDPLSSFGSAGAILSGPQPSQQIPRTPVRPPSSSALILMS